MFDEIAKRVSNLILQNADQIQADWDKSIKCSDQPEKQKQNVGIKIVLTNPDGNSKKARITLKWAVNAEHVLECDVEDNGQPPSLFPQE
jgi:hypothetical protein